MKLTCHCKNVEIEVAQKPSGLTSCNCSLCNRYAALWGYYSPGDVSLRCKNEAVEKYIWGDRCIEFYHCSHCGCVTHYVTTKKVAEPKVAVNFRMTSPNEISSIKIRQFDGADSWKYIN